MVRQHTSKNGSMNELAQDEHRILVDAIHDSATVIHKGQRMNKRIRELAEQATECYSNGQERTFNKEKFAQLIGQECLALADNIRDNCDADGSKEQALGAAWVGLAIARHFGVAE